MACTNENWIVKTKMANHYWKAEVRTPDIMDREGKHAIKFGQLIAVCYGKNTVNNANLIALAVNSCIAINPNNPQAIAITIQDMYQVIERIVNIEQTTGKNCALCGGYLDHKDDCLFLLAEQVSAKIKGK